MQSSAGSRITYYHLARKNLTERYPKLFNVLLIMILISMTGLAAFLISDIMSFASDSNHRGILAGFELQDSKNSFMSMTDWSLAGANSSRNESNQSHLKTNSSETSLNSSLMGNTSSSSQASERFIISSISSNNSSIIAKQESSYTQPRKHHGSGSSAATQNSAKKSDDQQRIKQENNSQTNKTSTRPPSINETATNKSSIEDEEPTINVKGNGTKLPVKENNSVTPGIMPAISGGDSVTEGQSFTDPAASAQDIIKNVSAIESVAKTKFKTKSTASLKTGNVPNLDGTNITNSIDSKTVSRTGAPSVPGSLQNNLARGDNNSTQISISKDPKTDANSLTQRKKSDASKESSSIASPSKTQKLKDARDLQMVNRNRIAEEKKKKTAQ